MSEVGKLTCDIESLKKLVLTAIESNEKTVLACPAKFRVFARSP